MQNEYKSYGHWKLLGKLGCGGFGEVLHWRQRITGQEIATKHLKNNPSLGADEIEKQKQRWQQEYSWLQNLNTDHFVRGIKLSEEDASFLHYLNDKHAWRPSPVLVMEYCNGGDLRKQLQCAENANGLPEFQVREILKSLSGAIAFLHEECKICHRDLKPDNVVIQLSPHGGRKIYKLTDFGFARPSPEQTAKQSVVGTRHYFAPEILDTAKYNNNVDYWSLGVIAYELSCGILPFIPHQDLFTIITNIRKKKETCISITEELGSESKHFRFNDELPPEQHLTRSFSAQLTLWLRLVLNVDYKKRGYINNGMTMRAADEVQGNISIFTELNKILKTKVLTAYCLNKYKFLNYEVNTELTLRDLAASIEHDTGIKYEDLFIVLPMGHPHKTIGTETKPIDLFVDNWQDPTEQDSEPVMIYIIGYNCPYETDPDPVISDTIQHLIALKPSDKIQPWQLNEFIRHTHYVISNEQQHLLTYLRGLKDYAMTVEHVIHEYDMNVKNTEINLQIIPGSLQQFEVMLQTGKQANEHRFSEGVEFFRIWENEYKKLQKTGDVLKQNVQHMSDLYISAVRNIKEAALSEQYNQIINSDIYGLKAFRHQLLSSKQKIAHASDQVELCKGAIYKCMHEPDENLIKFNRKLYVANLEYQQELLNAWQRSFRVLDSLNESMKALSCDGVQPNGHADDNAITCNKTTKMSTQFSLMDTTLDNLNTPELLKEAVENINRMAAHMEVDTELPTTLQQVNGQL